MDVFVEQIPFRENPRLREGGPGERGRLPLSFWPPLGLWWNRASFADALGCRSFVLIATATLWSCCRGCLNAGTARSPGPIRISSQHAPPWPRPTRRCRCAPRARTLLFRRPLARWQPERARDCPSRWLCSVWCRRRAGEIRRARDAHLAGNSVLLARDLDQQWRPQPGDNAIGLGMARGPQGLRLAVLSASARSRWSRFRARCATGLRFRSADRFRRVCAPIGLRRRSEWSRRSPQALAGRVSLQRALRTRGVGRYAIEILAEGARGPEVLFLRSVAVGPKAPWRCPRQGRGRDDAAAVLEQINRERQKYGAPALASDARLAAVAQALCQGAQESSGSSGTFSPRSGI